MSKYYKELDGSIKPELRSKLNNSLTTATAAPPKSLPSDNAPTPPKSDKK